MQTFNQTFRSPTDMITTSFAYGESYGVKDHYNDDERDYDDFMSADDYDRRRAIRDGWQTGTWDGRC